MPLRDTAAPISRSLFTFRSSRASQWTLLAAGIVAELIQARLRKPIQPVLLGRVA